MDFEYSPSLDLLVGKFAVGVSVIHVVEQKVEVGNFINGVDENHNFGIFSKLKISNGKWNSLLFSHKYILLL